MTQAQMTQAPQTTQAKGFKVLLMGSAGSGKTYSLASLADCDLKVRYLWLEDAYDSTARFFLDRRRPLPSNIAWHRVPVVSVDVEEILEITKRIHDLTFQGVSAMSDPNRQKHDGFIRFQSALASYEDQRTATNLGRAASWGLDTVLVIDSFSEFTEAAVRNAIGLKPLRGPEIVGLVQNNISMVVDWLKELTCHVVITAHVEREVDEVQGGLKVMVSTIGKKLAPQLPRRFSDVIHARRDGKTFSWSTDTQDYELKTRLLPYASGQTPTFAALVAKWRELAAMSQAPASNQQPSGSGAA